MERPEASGGLASGRLDLGIVMTTGRLLGAAGGYGLEMIPRRHRCPITGTMLPL
jgi:hypothetical protein